MKVCPLMQHLAIVSPISFLFPAKDPGTWGWLSLHSSPFEHANSNFEMVSLVLSNFLQICPRWEVRFSCQWSHLADEWGVQTQAACVSRDPASPKHSAICPPSYSIHMSRSSFHKSPSSLLKKQKVLYESTPHPEIFIPSCSTVHWGLVHRPLCRRKWVEKSEMASFGN